VDRVWGEPPGNLDTDGEHLLVSGVRLGNVFVGVQPSFGYEGDPMRLLFEKGATPHHGFLAYYRWIDEVFRAHAVVHLGTHGALEFMPGKQAGLSSDCWPDLLMSRVPHLYIYAVNNPSEGTIAKRRGLAVTLSHLTPPVEAAGLYRELENLSVSIEEYRTSEDGTRRRRVAEALVEMCEKLHLTSDVPRPRVMEGAEMDRFVGRLHTHLMEIKTRRIPVGLHVLGMQPRKELETELLASIGEHARSEEGLASFLDLWLSPAGLDAETLDRRSREGDASSVDLLALARRELEATLEVLDACGVEGAVAETLARRPGMEGVALFALLEYLEGVGQKIRATDELGPLMSALLGRYVPPGPGGDPVRCPLVLPTGRNLHALDPAKVPSAGALERAEVVVKELLLRRTRELGHPPRSIGMVLWGLDNIKTHGEAIAQAFLLLGTRPVADSIGRLSRVEVIPLSELGRPRVDVVITASGIFRDIFGLQMVLLDEAVRKVAELDESPDENFVRARTVEMTRAGISRDRATRRVFSNLPGAYGANVDHMVGMSTWKERSDLASIFLRRKGFSFSRDGEGEDARDVLAALAPGIDTTFQNLDSSEVGLVDVDHYFEYLGGLTALVEWKSGKRPAAVVADATTARVRVRSLEETVRLEVRTKLLNPRWIEGMLAHGYQGVEEVRKRLDYTFGWSATAQAVESWVYSEVLDTLVKDASVRQRMRVANPHSYSSLLDRLAEAEARGFFTPTDEEKEVLDRERERSEDVIEGVTSSR
jgi:magnesium chelatase subunit H